MEEVYFKDDCLALYYNRQHQTVRAVWNGFLSGETLRQAIEQCTRLLDEEKPLHWLADNRKMKAIRQKDQEWIQAYLVPKIVASSLRRMATLVSEDIFNRMAIENLFVRAHDQIKFDHQYFKNEKEATQWLDEKYSMMSQWR